MLKMIGLKSGKNKRKPMFAAHVKGSDVLAVNTLSPIIDSKNDTYYLHGIKDCPDLSKSVYLTPTAEDSWDPYSVYCLRKTGNFAKNISGHMNQECHWITKYTK